MEKEHKKWSRLKRQPALLDKYAHFILPYLAIIFDYLAIVLAEYSGYQLRLSVTFLGNAGLVIPPLYFWVIVPGVFLLFLELCKTYASNMPFYQLAKRIFYATSYAILAAIFLMYFGKVGNEVSRLLVAFIWFLAYWYILVLRYMVGKMLRHSNMVRIPILIVGAGKTAELVVKAFSDDPGFSYKIIGFIDDNPISKEIENRYSILGRFEDVEYVVRQTGVQEVLISAPGLESEKLIALINKVQPLVKNVAFIPDLIGTPLGGLKVESLMEERLMVLQVRNNLARPYNRLFKRCFDIAMCALGLVVIVPVLFFVGLAIYIDSPGPIFFAHQRVGRGGKLFPCYKFRSMVVDAEKQLNSYLKEHPEAQAEWNKDFKLKDDPRITRVGKFLRKTSLDELPQLINVIRGEMSLVGPRPIVEAEISRYKEFIHDYYLVPPGITGMWQVNGRSDTTYDERVEMDSWYVRNWSVWIDLIYLFKTVKVVFLRKGAY